VVVDDDDGNDGDAEGDADADADGGGDVDGNGDRDREAHGSGATNPDVIGNGNVIGNAVDDAAEEDEEASGDVGPYKDDMDYLEDAFHVIVELVKVANFKEKTEEDRYQNTKRPVEALQREAEAKQRKAFSRFSRRLAKTRALAVPLPRLELLVDKLGLDHMERMIILVLIGIALSQPVRKALRADPQARYEAMNVAKLLRILCGGELKDEVAARFHFYKRGRLVRSGIINVEAPYSLLVDLGECAVDLDHLIMDYCVGLRTEVDELMDSARCYTPKVSMDTVVLPTDMKELLLRQAENYELFRKLRKEVVRPRADHVAARAIWYRQDVVCKRIGVTFRPQTSCCRLCLAPAVQGVGC
jgi:hypothetical protein